MGYTSEKLESFRRSVRWPKRQRMFFIRHCEERQYLKLVDNKVHDESKVNKRRGNLLALIQPREVFNIFCINSSLQTQCREIASGMQQRLNKFISTKHLTAPRNDEIKCEGRLLQTSRIQQRIEKIIL